jgi:hypothetical protein
LKGGGLWNIAVLAKGVASHSAVGGLPLAVIPLADLHSLITRDFARLPPVSTMWQASFFMRSDLFSLRKINLILRDLAIALQRTETQAFNPFPIR